MVPFLAAMMHIPMGKLCIFASGWVIAALNNQVKTPAAKSGRPEGTGGPAMARATAATLKTQPAHHGSCSNIGSCSTFYGDCTSAVVEPT